MGLKGLIIVRVIKVSSEWSIKESDSFFFFNVFERHKIFLEQHLGLALQMSVPKSFTKMSEQQNHSDPAVLLWVNFLIALFRAICFGVVLNLNTEDFIYSPLLFEPVYTHWIAIIAASTTEVFHFFLSRCFCNLLITHEEISSRVILLQPISSLFDWSPHFGPKLPCSCPWIPPLTAQPS